MFNAPFSNTRSVAELTIAEIVMLFRRIFPKSVKAHEGAWDKSAVDSTEARGKVLGIVGYGNIGSQLAVLAEPMGMRVIYFEPHRQAPARQRRAGRRPLRPAWPCRRGVAAPARDARDSRMIGAREIAAMKKGAYLINNARGTILDLDALAAALKSGHLMARPWTSFPVEPSSNADAFVIRCRGSTTSS